MIVTKGIYELFADNRRLPAGTLLRGEPLSDVALKSANNCPNSQSDYVPFWILGWSDLFEFLLLPGETIMDTSNLCTRCGCDNLRDSYLCPSCEMAIASINHLPRGIIAPDDGERFVPMTAAELAATHARMAAGSDDPFGEEMNDFLDEIGFDHYMANAGDR